MSLKPVAAEKPGIPACPEKNAPQEARKTPGVRRVLFVTFVVLLALAAREGSHSPSCKSWLSPSSREHPPQATVRNGTYEGLYTPGFNQDLFLGMPYAQDTGGPNRFRIPQALNTTWSGARTATRYSHACPDFTPQDDDLWGMSENCLSINVVRPAGNPRHQKLPVLFWIHGGSYQVGTSGLDRYNLSWIVDRSVQIGRPILAASINYRKGGWGFMHSIEVKGSGNTNLALRDMRQALAWVQENIAAFGGDASRVTIWGESAGSFAVGQLLMSYGGRVDGLFHRSIQQSGSAATAWYNGTAWYQPIYDKIVKQTGCSVAPDTLACLRTVPYDILYPLMGTEADGPVFYPTVDGDILPRYPTDLLHAGRFAHVPHLYGSNSDEGTDNAPAGTINTDDDLYNHLLHKSGFNFPEHVVRRIMQLYPDDPSQGIPLNTGNERFASRGRQFKRAAAILGDVYYHAPRLDDARHYSRHNPNGTFIYRFNTRPWVSALGEGKANPACADGEPVKQVMGKACGGLGAAYAGVAHATELAFLFGNPSWLGPWPKYKALSEKVQEMWINFAHDGNPNRPSAGLRKGRGREGGEGGKSSAAAATAAQVAWPPYASGGDEGANFVLQTEEQGGFYVEPDTYRLAGREFLTEWARRRHV